LETYSSSAPFPHLVLDNIFEASILDALIDELPSLDSDCWVHDRKERIVKSNIRSAVDLGSRAFDFLAVLNSAGFLYFLTEITGLKALLPDPYLTGAGYSVMQNGGKFDVHADRNTDHYSGLERRIVMLIYLNREWTPENGGQLEIWDKEGKACVKSIDPIFNRTVIFEIADSNFHAVRPVVTQANRARLCFTSYFHTAGRDVVPHYSIYAPALYQESHPPERAKAAILKGLLRDATPPFLYRKLQHLRGRSAAQ
jgi:hypothetical protein